MSEDANTTLTAEHIEKMWSLMKTRRGDEMQIEVDATKIIDKDAKITHIDNHNITIVVGGLEIEVHADLRFGEPYLCYKALKLESE